MDENGLSRADVETQPGREPWKAGASPAMIERECLLFEAGDYPDRGVTITPEDLREIAANSARRIPVKVEHLRESPFDGALGTVTHLRVVGNQLWGTLQQPLEAWRFVRRAGARALSIALDVAGRRLAEVSFVCRPRVAAAQVFGQAEGSVDVAARAIFETERLYEEERSMTSVRQFVEGLMQYLRGALGSGDSDSEQAALAAERERLAAEREAIRDRRIDQQIAEFKRRGLLRATEQAEDLARAILAFGETNVVQFAGEETPLAALFAAFLERNGAVVPTGELARSDAWVGSGASDRLIAMAREMARREQVAFGAAFAQVSGAHPELARAAREEALNS